MFSSLNDAQREAAEIIVQNAIDCRNGHPKLKQSEIGEMVGVTDRTVRSWLKDEIFLSYMDYLSRLQLKAAMPDFAAVLITNLSKGQNLSTKQLDLIAKVADWMPETKASNSTTVHLQLGTESLEERLRSLEMRKANIVPNTPLQRRIEAEDGVFHETE